MSATGRDVVAERPGEAGRAGQPGEAGRAGQPGEAGRAGQPGEAASAGQPGEARDSFAGSLRAAGLRVTAPRLAVLLALEQQPHADTETVANSVRRQLGSVSPQAVYNVLAALVEVGLVRRIEPAFSPARYELRVGDNHHHIVCRRCLAAVDVDCVVGRRPCLTPIDAHGFALDEAEVTFWGICPSCLETERKTSNNTRKTSNNRANGKETDHD